MQSPELERWFLICLTALSIVFWCVAIARLAKDKPLLVATKRNLLPWQPAEVMLGLASFVLLPAFAIGLVAGQPDHIRILVASLSQLTAATLVGAFLVLRHRVGVTSSERRLGLSRAILLGFFAFVMWIPFVLGIQLLLTQWFPYEHSTISVLHAAEQHERPIIAATTFFSAAICAPLAEEFFFRWLLQGWLQNLWFSVCKKSNSIEKAKNRPVCWPAIVGTSLVFAGLHVGQGPAPISLFVLSLGIGYLFDRTGSLVSCIVIHFLLNAMTMSFLILRLF